MALFTSDWNPLGKDIYYRKFELNPMLWSHEVNLKDFFITGASFGGPIALVEKKNWNRLQTTNGTNTVKSNVNSIFIFSSFGTLLSTIKWTANTLALIEWSNREDLLCIQDDGIVLVYDIFGNLQNTFTLDQEIRDTKILECKTFHGIHGTGIAVLTTSYRFFVLNNINEPKIRRLAEVPGLAKSPSSWAVIASNGETIVLVAKDNDLYSLNANDQSCQPMNTPFSSPFNEITEMSISFDSTHVALLTDTGILWMGWIDTNLHNYCEFETKTKTKPQQLLWCANSAVVGLWKNILLVVGPDKDWLNYVIDQPVHMVQEIDGIRIVANDIHEMFQRVSPVVVDIFGIGSIAAGALLLEANKEFQRHSHKADEYIRMIYERNEMEKSVEQCIEAAGHEYGISTQKMLLRAASFGKCFVPKINTQNFVQMCQTLRILNAIRHHTIGIPLTYTQLEMLTMETLIDRLILRRNFCLALRIASYLKLPDERGAARVLGNWALLKVKQTFLDDERIARDISNKLGYSSGISYSDIANKAIEFGRTQLAIKLLDHELRASQQVPLLLKLKQHRLALKRAIESGDTNLIHTVIIRLREVLPAGEFLMTIRDYPIAYSLFKKYCNEAEPEKLTDLYYQEDDFVSEANSYLFRSLKACSLTQQQSCLQSALDSYKKSKNDFNSSIIDENIRLIKYQIKLKDKFQKNYINLSLHQTMRQLIVDKEYKLSEELKKEFKVGDRRYWWLKVTVLAEMGEWLELEKFSKIKKSPIGYEPFVDICLDHHNRYEAQKYLLKINEENRVKYYVRCGLLEDAAKFAFEAKDIEALDYVLSKCGPTNRMLADKIITLKSQIIAK
ncbi:vacuolar protein sorting-associated protein 16 homolog [Oppia nitens]|uniref:vacuolar protein sorting-associated protein 16 homolog n=1 Tax=Oppia nitens TaxID=1686743 RepID=UPI0023DB7D1F|nr:vacuolar protein sorting-associated protein 16 homolog [Oppia nitens]